MSAKKRHQTPPTDRPQTKTATAQTLQSQAEEPMCEKENPGVQTGGTWNGETGEELDARIQDLIDSGKLYSADAVTLSEEAESLRDKCVGFYMARKDGRATGNIKNPGVRRLFPEMKFSASGIRHPVGVQKSEPVATAVKYLLGIERDEDITSHPSRSLFERWLDVVRGAIHCDEIVAYSPGPGETDWFVNMRAFVTWAHDKPFPIPDFLQPFLEDTSPEESGTPSPQGSGGNTPTKPTPGRAKHWTTEQREKDELALIDAVRKVIEENAQNGNGASWTKRTQDTLKKRRSVLEEDLTLQR